MPALVAELDSPGWRVRRSCCGLPDDLDFTPTSLAALKRALEDPDLRVRDAVMNPLGWRRHGPWAERLVEYMAVNDQSEKLRENARGTLASRALERAADAQRRRLPEHLRWKTERHPFQWVAPDGEQLLAGRLSKAIGWDLRRWLGAGDATAVSARGLRWYFVLPDRPEAR